MIGTATDNTAGLATLNRLLSTINITNNKGNKGTTKELKSNHPDKGPKHTKKKIITKKNNLFGHQKYKRATFQH